MKKMLVFDSRKLKEILHCLFYKQHLAHGTVGHNLLLLAAETFEALGFSLSSNNELMFREETVPTNVTFTATFSIDVNEDWGYIRESS